jgi:hypothetical protein
MRDTSLLLMPLSAPRAQTRSSTLRVLTPCKYASMTTANNAWSTRRRRSNNEGKNDPARSFGIRNSRSQPLCSAAVAGGRCAGSAAQGCAGWGGADHRGELGLDQGLVDRLGRLADAVIDLRDLECVQDL